MVMVANAEKDVVICGDNSRDCDEVPNADTRIAGVRNEPR